MADPVAPDPFDTRRRMFLLLAATGSLSMIFVDITVTAIAGPAISASLGPDSIEVAWIANAYLITLAALTAIGGRLGDLAGKRNTFLVGVTTFAAASAVCGAANDGTTLIVGRILQGIGACLMQPAASALIIENFPAGERGKAMGFTIGISMSFFALGPLIGGFLTEHAGWRWVFFVNLPIALASIASFVAARVPNRVSGDRSFDLLSAGLLATGLPLAIYALQESAPAQHAVATGATPPFELKPSLLAMLGAGVMLTSLFAYRQLSVARPLIHLGLFADARLRANVLLIGLMQFAMAPLVVQGALYAREALGYSSQEAGMSLMPLLIPVILLARFAGRLYDRIGVRPLARFGTLAATAGLATWGAGAMLERYPVIAVGMLLLGTGLAFIMSPASTDTLSRTPDGMRGQVSGLAQTARQIGGAAGVAFAAAACGFAGSLGAELPQAIGWATIAGAAVAAVGIVIAWSMPRTASTG